MTFFSNLTLLALASASHGANGIINSTTSFIGSRHLKWDATWHFGYVMSLALALALHDTNSRINSTTPFFLLKRIQMRCNMTFFPYVIPLPPALASCDANGIVYCTIAFARSKILNELKHYIFGYVKPLPPAMASQEADGIINIIIAFIRSWDVTGTSSSIMWH